MRWPAAGSCKQGWPVVTRHIALDGFEEKRREVYKYTVAQQWQYIHLAWNVRSLLTSALFVSDDVSLVSLVYISTNWFSWPFSWPSNKQASVYLQTGAHTHTELSQWWSSVINERNCSAISGHHSNKAAIEMCRQINYTHTSCLCLVFVDRTGLD